ncbi:winged helix-turn-helix transcriptional regulator [Candidatus Woesearchaeota archaeon]|nr:winged helix-turn-helix transcriptional regulator [Candidatus Woesearchaeota archaeon]
MNNKNLGGLFLVCSIVLTIIIIILVNNLSNQAEEFGCFENKNCIKVESGLSIVHVAFGFLGFMLSLGFYLIFFSKTEEEILRQLKENKNASLKEEKFGFVMKGLNNYEKKVMNIVKGQDGITQNTLRIRTDMSKAKLSYVLQDLEKKGLIKRIKKGKTLAVHLKENF